MKVVKIKYITNVRIPTPRAQGYAIMKMCSEFARAGADTELFIPSRDNTDSKKDSFDFYRIEKNFEIKKVPSFDFLGKTLNFGRIFYWLDIFSFLFSVRHKENFYPGDIIYTRDFLTSLFLSKKYFLCLELHDIPLKKFLFKLLIKKFKIIFALTSYIKDEVIKMGVKEDSVFVIPSGVDLKDFDVKENKEEAREKVDLPQDKKIVLYSGQFYKWKGIETLAQSSKLLPEIVFVFFGGIDPEYSEFIKKFGKLENIIIRPFQEREVVPLYLKAADVLVISQSAKEKISTHYSSPLKMFEYMAAKKPIVAPNLPSIRETLDESCAVLAEPDSPDSFALAIKKILSDNEFANKIAEKAYSEVQKYSWSERAQSILKIIKNYA